jgi:hypothetical protein
MSPFPKDHDVAIIDPKSIPDYSDRALFELAIKLKLPTANEFRRMRLRDEMRLRKEVQTALCDAFTAVGVSLKADHRKLPDKRGKGKFQLTWRLPGDCLFQSRAILEPHVYRADNHATDSRNYVLPLDKLILDMLCLERPGKWRGFGMIQDDSDEFLYMFMPTVHYGAQDCVLLQFYAPVVPSGLVREVTPTLASS